MAIIKTNNFPEEIIKELEKAKVSNIEIGSVWVSVQHYGAKVCRITGIKNDKKYGVQIYYQEASNWEATEWKKESNTSIDQWKEYYGEKLDKPFSEYYEQAKKVISGEIPIESFEDKSSDSLSSETALVGKDSKASLTAMQQSLEEKKKKAEMVHTFVQYEMERKRRELDRVREKLQGVLAVFEKKIKKVMRVITTIELYLGIDEEIFQLQEGAPAPQETPISFRQMVLFMDEEVAEDEKLGKVDFGGLDYTNIKQFDEWLLKDGNYKKVLPEQRGMLVFKPRRKSKDYGDGDAFGSGLKNSYNRLDTYFLIRNGENLYRIFTEKIIIFDRLFPKKEELAKLFEKTAKLVEEENFESRKEEAREKLDDAFYYYQKQAILMQGLIDRTSIFHPLPKQGISVFKMDQNAECFNFIYDDEAALPSGRLPFWDWVKKENEKIGHGSRIVIVDGLYRNDGWDYRGADLTGCYGKRLFRDTYKEKGPDAPKSGIYEVENFKYYKTETQKKYKKEYKHEELEKAERYKKDGWVISEETDYKYIWKKFEEEALTISYNPGGEVLVNWTEYRERKNNLRFKIFKDDGFILNYDQISLDDINFYLSNRTDRVNYLEMMPMLRTLKKWRLKEIEKEKDFVKMVVGQIIKEKKDLVDSAVEKRVWELVEWWKFKNKIKRPIDKDDAKALRMIIKKFSDKQVLIAR